MSIQKNIPLPGKTKNHQENLWSCLLGTESAAWLLAALLVNGVLILFTAKVTLQAFPLSPDEYVYQLSAHLFAEGKLSVPAPQPQGFFDTLDFINTGTYYGKYPPGWPALLALGTPLGLGWLVNPVFGLLTLAALFVLCRELFSPALSNIVMMLSLACPYFIFNSSCFMPHASCLLLLMLSTYFLLVAERKFGSFIGFGMTAGFAFLIRPFTTLLVLIPFTLYFLWSAVRQRDYAGLRDFLLVSMPVGAAFLGLFLLYNYAQTGHPFLQPFEVYNPSDHLGFFHHTWKEYGERFDQNILERTGDWVQWTCGIPLLVLAFMVRGKIDNPAYRSGLLFTAPALCLLIGYYFYFGSGITQYGPRYLYESYAFMLIPAAIGLLCTRRWAPLLLAVILALNGVVFLKETAVYRNMVEDHVKFFKLTDQLSNAIVFIHASSVVASRYFLRNGLDFNYQVLLVLDRGPEENQEIIKRFPGRTFYICDFDTSDWGKMLKPYQN